jgi:hypothetical protein
MVTQDKDLINRFEKIPKGVFRRPKRENSNIFMVFGQHGQTCLSGLPREQVSLKPERR